MSAGRYSDFVESIEPKARLDVGLQRQVRTGGPVGLQRRASGCPLRGERSI